MRPRWQRILFGVIYWVAVLVVSLAILVALVLLIESRDQSSVEDEGSAAGLVIYSIRAFTSRAKITTRLRRAVERVAGAQHEPLGSLHPVGDPGRVGLDDLLLLDLVLEASRTASRSRCAGRA